MQTLCLSSYSAWVCAENFTSLDHRPVVSVSEGKTRKLRGLTDFLGTTQVRWKSGSPRENPTPSPWTGEGGWCVQGPWGQVFPPICCTPIAIGGTPRELFSTRSRFWVCRSGVRPRDLPVSWNLWELLAQGASEHTIGILVEGVQGVAAEGPYYGGNCQIEQKRMAGVNSMHRCCSRSEKQPGEPVRPMIHVLSVGTGVARRSFVNRAPQMGRICDCGGAEGGQCTGAISEVQRCKELHVVGGWVLSLVLSRLAAVNWWPFSAKSVAFPQCLPQLSPEPPWKWDGNQHNLW